MKNIIYIILSVLMITAHYGCEKNDTGVNNVGGNGQGGSLARFTISGNYMYIVGTNTLTTYDISNPSTLIKKGSIEIGNGIETIYPYKDKLFIGSNNAMYIYSIANPAEPKYESMATHVRACDPVVANDQYAYVTVRSGVSCGGTINALMVYNIQNSSSYPSLSNTINLKNPHGLGLNGSTLYVCDYDQGIKVFDITNQSLPELVKTVSGYTVKDVIVYGDILVVMTTEGMAIYDITTPANPTFVTLVS